MFIKCVNCNKNFDIDASLIPEKGRLLQCSACDHKWFFKKEIIKEPISSVNISKPTEEIKSTKVKLEDIKIKNFVNIELLDKKTQQNIVIDNTPTKISSNNKLDTVQKKNFSKNKKKYNILGLTIVFIISFIALIIILDTFQGPISRIIPNIEFILYSLYETINDIKLFLKDLI